MPSPSSGSTAVRSGPVDRSSSGTTIYREGPTGRSTGEPSVSTRSGDDAGSSSGMWRARSAADSSGTGSSITGIPDGDWSTREAPPVRFPRLSDSGERSSGIPGSGPSANTEMRRRSSPDLEVRRGEGQSEWRNRTVTREDLLQRYKPSDADRGRSSDAGSPPAERSRTDGTSRSSQRESVPLSESRRELGRGSPGGSSSTRGGTDDVVRGAPGATRGRAGGAPSDDTGRNTRGEPSARDGRGSGGTGSDGTRSRRAPTREQFRDLPPDQRQREVVDLPRRDLGKARTVRNASNVISSASNIAIGLTASTVVGFTNSSCYDWDCWYGYNCGWNGYWDSCAYWWWNPCWSSCWWGCSPYWGWGWGWSYYWNYCGWYWSWYPSYGTVYLGAPPVAYSTIVYETVEYQEEQPAAEYTDTGEDVQPTEEAGITQSEGVPSIDREQELNRAADYYLTLGDRAFREGRYGDAVHYYAKAVEFSSDDGILYLILSDALFATGDYHYAAYALRKALELDPTLASSVVDKHSFYSDPAEFDRQLAVLERYLEDHFQDDDARLVLAANYLFGNRPAAAVDLLDSTFSKTVAETPAGAQIRAAAKAIQFGRPVPETVEPPPAEVKD